jgi:hypothetical protein
MGGPMCNQWPLTEHFFTVE